jgi:hypothetical protein
MTRAIYRTKFFEMKRIFSDTPCCHLPGVDFINILRTAFTHVGPKSAKKADSLTVFFALLGSGHVKIACKMLIDEIDPWLKFC